jgi:hypothetical protein
MPDRQAPDRHHTERRQRHGSARHPQTFRQGAPKSRYASVPTRRLRADILRPAVREAKDQPGRAERRLRSLSQPRP